MKLLLDRMGVKASDLIIKKPGSQIEPAKVTSSDSQGDANE